MQQNIGIIIVDKLCTLKTLTVKDYKEEELYKKCGFKVSTGFAKQTTWPIRIDGKRYSVSVYAKKDGKANTENKYDFPPPIDTALFFGSCAIVAKEVKEGVVTETPVSLSLDLWNKMYEKLFGGFEDLTTAVVDDEYEEDELDNVPVEKKTKQGYLKDGFVIDSDGDAEGSDYESGEEEDEEESFEDEKGGDNELSDVEDLASELCEEEYSDDEE